MGGFFYALFLGGPIRLQQAYSLIKTQSHTK